MIWRGDFLNETRVGLDVKVETLDIGADLAGGYHKNIWIFS